MGNKVNKRITSVNVDTTKLSKQFRKNKANKASDLLLTLLQSNTFKAECENMDLEYWKKGESESSIAYDKTGSEIYHIIMQGCEEWNNKKDYTANIFMKNYRGKAWSKVVAYMNPGQALIFVNERFFDVMSLINVVKNMGHEWFHTLGGRHSGTYFRQSVSYFMNYALEKTYQKLIIQKLPDLETTPAQSLPKPQYKKHCYQDWRFLWLRKTCKLILL